MLGHPIIGSIGQDALCLGSDCANLRVLSQSRPPRRPGLGGSSPCAKEVWDVPLQSRNSYHVDFSKGMHHTAVESAAGTTKWWMERLVRKGHAHTLTSSLPSFFLSCFPSFFLSFSPYALNHFTHTYIHTHRPRILWLPYGWRNLRAVGLCRATLQGRGHKTKALVTWKNSCNLQEEVEHLRDDVWILSVLFWAKCQSRGGCCWMMSPPPSPSTTSTSQTALHPTTIMHFFPC